MFRLGKIFYHGSIYHSPGGAASGGEGVGRVPRDFDRAHYYFSRIARQIWPHDPVDPLSHSPRREEGTGPVGYAAAAAGFIGRMFLRGEGVRPDFAMARMWFERGAEYGDKESHNGLGIIWRDGLVGGKRDLKKSVGYFTIAAGQELSEAQVNLGKHHYCACPSSFNVLIACPDQTRVPSAEGDEARDNVFRDGVEARISIRGLLLSRTDSVRTDETDASANEERRMLSSCIVL